MRLPLFWNRKPPVADKPPLLLFDFDGVVADSFEVFFREFSGTAADLRFEKLRDRETLLRLFDGNMIQSMIMMGFPVRKLKRLLAEFGPRIAAANAQVPPFAGMPELLRELAKTHPTYIITSNLTEAITGFLERHEITGIRDVLGSDKESSKVKKIKKVARLHRDLTPWYIGDTKGDMLEGAAARAITVAAAWGWHPEERLLEAKPMHVARTPEDLRRLFLPAAGGTGE